MHAAKRRKDLAQADELVAVLHEDMPDELAAALRALRERGDGFIRMTEAGLRVANAETRETLSALR